MLPTNHPLRQPADQPQQPSHPRQSGRPARRVRHELSAGGVAVRHSDGQWLVALLKTEHKRGAVWVLPKGHVELPAGENISEAARREVEEEAGLRDLSVKDQLGVTRFSFQAEGTLVKKTVHYFLMITQQKQLTPQAAEGLIEANWFSFDEAIKNLAYDTDQMIVAKAKAKLTGQATPHPRHGRGPRRGYPRIHR